MLQLRKIEQTTTVEEIVPVYTTDKDIKVVYARDLHQALGLKKKFADWIKSHLDDYVRADEDAEDGNYYDYYVYEMPASYRKGKVIEYILTLDMAKELAMQSRSIMGRRIRKYFVELEKTAIKMATALQESTSEEKIAEALLLAQSIIAKKNDEIIKANRNKEYNKKVNKELRAEKKYLTSRLQELKVQLEEAVSVKEIDLDSEIDEKINYLELALEQKEEEVYQLSNKVKALLKIKIDGKALLDAIVNIDIARRQGFALSSNAKQQAKINAYSFRKESILKAGIIVDDSQSRFVDTINVEDMPKALTIYINALRKLINNNDYFEELFATPLKRTAQYLSALTETKEEEEMM